MDASINQLLVNVVKVPMANVLSASLSIVLLTGQLASSEMFTAIVDLERIVQAEYQVARELKAFAEREQQRIETLKSLADNLEQHSAHALQNPEKHLSNPVNAFLTVKRLTTDWDFILKNYVRSNNSDDFLSSVYKNAVIFPNEEDLAGAADALLRLQDTYALPANRIAGGDLYPGLEDTALMTVQDCFELGRQAYLKKDYYHTVLWMREALRLLNLSKTESGSRIHVEILDHLGFATYMQNNVHEALRLTDECLKFDPDNVRLQTNREHYLNAISAGQISSDPAVKPATDEYRSSEDFTNYERLCRGENVFENDGSKFLSCHLRRHHPLFYISPLREEILYSNPRIVLYHNAVADHEIEKIKSLATPRLKRATVQNPITGELETATYRVSKSAWLKDFEDEVIQRVSSRAKAMVNLTGETVEELQVVNYGIGGHYEPHYDHARKTETRSFDEQIGNRIATFICYLSDVEAGGATVFNVAGARIEPEKGSCAIWYNLLRNGDGDSNTRHAACPVLVGSKWVMNKWFHERGEEFIRPCGLSAFE